MPQMKPMLWLNLFLLIIMIMLLMQIMTNFISLINNFNKKKLIFFFKNFKMKW